MSPDRPAVLPVVAPFLAADAAPAAGGPLEQLLSVLPLVLIGLTAWFVLFRPEQERARRQQELLAALKKHDRVVTSSGIYGTVVNVDRDADRVTLRIDEAGTVKISVTLASISKVLGEPAAETGSNG
jgi:preprotein translocase subunit YajC